MAQSVLHEQEVAEGPLSPWWVRSVFNVLAVGFSGLIAITFDDTAVSVATGQALIFPTPTIFLTTRTSAIVR